MLPRKQSHLTDTGFHFELPPECIAQRPSARREDSRLLHVRGPALRDLRFTDIVEEIDPGSVLVLNDTRVLAARLQGEKASGGRVEALVERVLGSHRALALLRASHAPKTGTGLFFGASPRFAASVRSREDDLYELEFEAPLDEVLARAGRLPLPPYIRHEPGAEDLERYQTVYEREPGAVAAPTAGLHFTKGILAALDQRGVQICRLTLHVGAGTFQPLRDPDPTKHRMHPERYDVPEATAQAVNAARREGRAVVAVGTTSLRTLEACATAGEVRPGQGETSLYILPGYEFRAVDRLVTNFHLPGTTLLLLACAFGGTDAVRAAYAHALAGGYRFFSYGDAMLLERGT
jgi:S-adenosylmethionine:tRNA ribosyltransferase-isomerase